MRGTLHGAVYGYLLACAVQDERYRGLPWLARSESSWHVVTGHMALPQSLAFLFFEGYFLLHESIQPIVQRLCHNLPPDLVSSNPKTLTDANAVLLAHGSHAVTFNMLVSGQSSWHQ